MDKIREIGNEWKHPRTGEVRYYLNREDWTKMAGLELHYYKSGNICSAYLDGEKISNSKALRILDSIEKVYVTEDGKCHIKGSDRYNFLDSIQTAVAKLTDEQP